MGGFFHLIDLKQGSMARKIVSQKGNSGGLEAPRNSLELPVGNCPSHCSPGDDEAHKYQGMHDWSELDCYPAEAPMKKLISDEISKRPKTRANAPSIVARLMGVDTLPLDTKPVTQRVEKKNENSGRELSKEKLTRSSSVGPALSPSKSLRQISLDSFHLDDDSDPDEWSSSTTLKKPKPQEHPQEEELQKFKKEFEAWQSARFKECSKIVEQGTSPSQWMAQENLNKQKMVLYENSGTKFEKIDVLKQFHASKAGSDERGYSKAHIHTNDFLSADEKGSFPVKRRTLSEDLGPSFLMPDQDSAASSAPTRIVILRPGFDSTGSCEEPWATSFGASEERDSIEDFLEEVKERLKCELQGKSFNRGGIVRGGGIETPYSEKLVDPKQIAQRIARQVRESVTKDLGSKLRRSESTRSIGGEQQCNGTVSPEYISRDTRRLLSERLRNVLKREAHSNISMFDDHHSKSSILTYDSRKLQSRDILNVEGKITFSGSFKDEKDSQSRSFRSGPDDDIIPYRELSPINLIRSLSAPVSRTSFGKLLLEDPHVVTGAHIRRKHEAIENLTVKVKKRRKEKFNLKEKVSSFKYSLTLKGRLFGRKIHSAAEFRSSDRDFVKDIMNGPTVTMNFADRPENSTEVPPSPASVCSSIHEDLWRAAYCASPTTTSGAPPSEENDLSQAFRDISSNLSELRKQLNQLESSRSGETMTEEQPFEAEMVELEDEGEAYIRDLLIASGLYENSCDTSPSRWDPFAKPVSNRVFEQVEESYKKKTKDNELSTNDQCGDQKKLDHKVLLDLLNEVLSTILAPPVQISKLRRKAMGTMWRPPHGKRLLDQVLEMLHVYLCPPTDKSFYSFDSMVARDLQSTPWSGLVNDDVDALAKELECQIIGDLMEETIKDLEFTM